MSRRNTLEAKRLRKALKTMRNKPPRYLSLYEFIRTRQSMSRGKAEKIIMAGCIKVDSHVIGVRMVTDDEGFKFRVVDPFVPAEWRGRIRIGNPDIEAVKAIT